MSLTDRMAGLAGLAGSHFRGGSAEFQVGSGRVSSMSLTDRMAGLAGLAGSHFRGGSAELQVGSG